MSESKHVPTLSDSRLAVLYSSQGTEYLTERICNISYYEIHVPVLLK